MRSRRRLVRPWPKAHFLPKPASHTYRLQGSILRTGPRRSRSLPRAAYLSHLHGRLSMSESHKSDPLSAGEFTELPSANDPDPSGRKPPAGAKPGGTYPEMSAEGNVYVRCLNYAVACL